MNRKIIIGLVGHPSSGKDTVADYIMKKYDFVHISTSDLIREYIHENKLGEPTRLLMHDTANLLRQKNGPDYLVIKALKKDAGRLILSGIRAVSEAKRVKDEGGFIVSLQAPIELRYKLAKERGRIGDDTFLQFKTIEEKEAENTDQNAQNVDGVMRLSDYTIENDGSIKDLHQKIDDVISKILR